MTEVNDTEEPLIQNKEEICTDCGEGKLQYKYVHFSDMYALELDYLNLCDNKKCDSYHDNCRIQYYSKLIHERKDIEQNCAIKKKITNLGKQFTGQEKERINTEAKKNRERCLNYKGFSKYSQICYLSKQKTFWIYTALFLIANILFHMYHNRVYEWSTGEDSSRNSSSLLPGQKPPGVGLTMWFQNRRSKWLDYVMLAFTNLVHPEGATLVLTFCLIIAKDKQQVYNFYSYCSIMIWVSMTLKAFTQDPRPYFTNTDIVPLQTYAEYGSPSGHVLMGYILMTYILEKFLFKYPFYCPISYKIDNLRKLHYCKYVFYHIIHVFVIAMIFISRIYLGMHSFDQCLMSLVVGIYFHYLYNMFFHEFLFDAMKRLQEASEFSLAHAKIFCYTILTHIIAWFLSYYIYIWINQATYFSGNKYPEDQKLWRQNIDAANAKKEIVLPEYKILYNKTFTDGFTVVAFLGMLYGLWIIDEKNIQNHLPCKMIKFYKDEEKKNRYWISHYLKLKNILRIIVFAVPFIASILLEQKIVPGDQIGMVYLGKTVLFLSFMIMLIKFFPQVYAYIGLDEPTDIITFAKIGNGDKYCPLERLKRRITRKAKLDALRKTQQSGSRTFTISKEIPREVQDELKNTIEKNIGQTISQEFNQPQHEINLEMQEIQKMLESDEKLLGKVGDNIEEQLKDHHEGSQTSKIQINIKQEIDDQARHQNLGEELTINNNIHIK